MPYKAAEPPAGQKRLHASSGPQKRANRPFPAISPVHGPIAHAEPCRSYRSPRVSSPAIHHRTGRWDPARYVANEASAVRPPETPHRVAHQGASVFVGYETIAGPAAPARTEFPAPTALAGLRPEPVDRTRAWRPPQPRPAYRWLQWAPACPCVSAGRPDRRTATRRLSEKPPPRVTR